MRRKQNDVFVLGEESLLAEPTATGESDPVGATNEREACGESPPRVPARSGAPAVRARRLAVLGLGIAAAATLGALELSGAGPASSPRRGPTSPHSALSASAAPSAPVPLAHPAPARLLDPKLRPRPEWRRARRPRAIHHSEPERKSKPKEAPVSSLVEVPAPPRPALSSAPVPTLPSRPPPPVGGGSGSGERFGFER